MVHTESFVTNVVESLAVKSNGFASNNFGHRSALLRTIRHDRVVSVCGVDVDILVAKSVNRHAYNKSSRRAHDCNQRVGRGITKEGFLDSVAIETLLACESAENSENTKDLLTKDAIFLVYSPDKVTLGRLSLSKQIDVEPVWQCVAKQFGDSFFYLSYRNTRVL